MFAKIIILILGHWFVVHVMKHGFIIIIIYKYKSLTCNGTNSTSCLTCDSNMELTDTFECICNEKQYFSTSY